MKQYPVKYRRVRDHKGTRCVNPHCGKWVELYREKICPKCEKRFVARADKRRCDECWTMLLDGDPVCPLCGSKQRSTVELRGVNPENLTAFSHLLHEARPWLSLTECRKKCRDITKESPYRVSFARRPDQIQDFIRRWNMLGGTAVNCLDRETSQQPVVLLHSYNRQHEMEYARLLFEAVQKSDHPSLSFGETVSILHRINKEEIPVSLCFISGFDTIDAWVDAWRSLGGTAVRSSEHRIIGRYISYNRWCTRSFADFFP